MYVYSSSRLLSLYANAHEFLVFFHLWDKDNSGSISRDEIVEMVRLFDRFNELGGLTLAMQLTIVREGTSKSRSGEQLGLQDDDVDLMMQKLDIDGNGDISFQEFSRVCFSTSCVFLWVLMLGCFVLQGVYRVPKLTNIFHLCFGEL